MKREEGKNCENLNKLIFQKSKIFENTRVLQGFCK